MRDFFFSLDDFQVFGGEGLQCRLFSSFPAESEAWVDACIGSVLASRHSGFGVGVEVWGLPLKQEVLSISRRCVRIY